MGRYTQVYDKWITVKKAAGMAFMAGVLPAVAAWVATANVPTTIDEWKAQWPFLASGIIGAAVRGFSNWWKHNGGGLPNFVLPFAMAALMLSGCATGLIRPSIGDHSSTIVEFDERTAVGDETRIKFRAHGEAASAAAVDYNGEGADPWRLSVRGDSTVTSPQAQAVAEGMATLLAETPQTIGGLAGQLSGITGLFETTGTDSPSVTRSIIQTLIERFIAQRFVATE